MAMLNNQRVYSSSIASIHLPHLISALPQHNLHKKKQWVIMKLRTTFQNYENQFKQKNKTPKQKNIYDPID